MHLAAFGFDLCSRLPGSRQPHTTQPHTTQPCTHTRSRDVRLPADPPRARRWTSLRRESAPRPRLSRRGSGEPGSGGESGGRLGRVGVRRVVGEVVGEGAVQGEGHLSRLCSGPPLPHGTRAHPPVPRGTRTRPPLPHGTRAHPSRTPRYPNPRGRCSGGKAVFRVLLTAYLRRTHAPETLPAHPASGAARPHPASAASFRGR